MYSPHLPAERYFHPLLFCHSPGTASFIGFPAQVRLSAIRVVPRDCLSTPTNTVNSGEVNYMNLSNREGIHVFSGWVREQWCLWTCGKISTVPQALLIIVAKATNTVMPLKLCNHVQSALFVWFCLKLWFIYFCNIINSGMCSMCWSRIGCWSQVTFTIQNVSKQLHCNKLQWKQENETIGTSVNVAKFNHYETNKISAVKQLYKRQHCCYYVVCSIYFNLDFCLVCS